MKIPKITNEDLNKAIVVLIGEHWHETGDWYCPDCKSYLDSSRVTYQEECDKCGSMMEIGCKHCERTFSLTDISHNPDYCSSRDLCADIVIGMSVKKQEKWIAKMPTPFDKIELIGLTQPRLWAEAIYETLKETEQNNDK